MTSNPRGDPRPASGPDGRAPRRPPTITADSLGHRFGEAPFLFRDLTLRLVPDRVYGVVGPSGCGKSTLLGILAGWLQPTLGDVAREGVQRIRWVFQNPVGVPRRSAVDHVALPLLALGRRYAEARAQALELLADFRLEAVADQPFSALSGGEAQRLMLARGLAGRPDLFLVDEPTAQLDQSTAATVSQALGGLSSRGCVVVVATHDPATKANCTDVIDLAAPPRQPTDDSRPAERRLRRSAEDTRSTGPRPPRRPSPPPTTVAGTP